MNSLASSSSTRASSPASASALSAAASACSAFLRWAFTRASSNHARALFGSRRAACSRRACVLASSLPSSVSITWRCAPGGWRGASSRIGHRSQVIARGRYTPGVTAVSHTMIPPHASCLDAWLWCRHPLLRCARGIRLRRCGGRGGGRTHTFSEERQILSLVRLPVPPLGRERTTVNCNWLARVEESPRAALPAQQQQFGAERRAHRRQQAPRPGRRLPVQLNL